MEDVTVRELLQGFGVRTRTERGASKP
jgi:hypothetical protein